MSKRKSSGDRSESPLSLELDEEQIAALQLVPDSLHPSLKCLVPVLNAIRKAYSDVIPAYKRALPVNTVILHDLKKYTDILVDSSSHRFQAHYRCSESAGY